MPAGLELALGSSQWAPMHTLPGVSHPVRLAMFLAIAPWVCALSHLQSHRIRSVARRHRAFWRQVPAAVVVAALICGAVSTSCFALFGSGGAPQRRLRSPTVFREATAAAGGPVGGSESAEGRALGELLTVGRLEEFDGLFAQIAKSLADSEPDEAIAGDLVYLSVLRKLGCSRLPKAPVFARPGTGSTWAMSGAEPQWIQIAGESAFELPLPQLLDSERNGLRNEILRGRAECGALVDAYMDRELGITRGQVPAKDVLFSSFLQRCRSATNEAVLNVGGSSGFSTNKLLDLAVGHEGDGRPEEPGEGANEWFAFLAELLTNTRIFQADAYFGHIFFGLCLCRLFRRFQLARSLGMLKPASDTALARAALEVSAAGSADADDPMSGVQSHLAAAAFESFVEGLAKEGGDAGRVLEQTLELTPTMVTAMRRQVYAIFGKGLRNEISRTANEASLLLKEVKERNGTLAERLDIVSSLLLEAGVSGKVRMLSSGPEAKERLAWDGILFGALLEQAEDSLFSQNE